MKTRYSRVATNRRVARRRWPNIPSHLLRLLEEITADHELSIARGELVLIDGQWYVTHTGLLSLARRKRCDSILTKPVHAFCDPHAKRWSFEATVYKSMVCRGFVGHGDADPSNVSPLVRGAEMRVAETRAVNRALRKAYGIGICSLEELGTNDRIDEHATDARKHPPQPAKGNNWATGSRVRDRLCHLIRNHGLDPDLVKAYATDFCGVKTLREASREQVENFVQSLADWATKDRNALLCQLNSYARAKEDGERKDGAA